MRTPQELREGDRVFSPQDGRRGSVKAVARWPMTVNESYWITVEWDEPLIFERIEQCLESQVKRVK